MQVLNKGREDCRDLMEADTNLRSYEKRKIKEDAKKYEQIIHQTRVRLGLEVAS